MENTPLNPAIGVICLFLKAIIKAAHFLVSKACEEGWSPKLNLPLDFLVDKDIKLEAKAIDLLDEAKGRHGQKYIDFITYELFFYSIVLLFFYYGYLCLFVTNFILNGSNNSMKKVKIKKAPGSKLLAIADFFYKKETVDGVFKQQFPIGELLILRLYRRKGFGNLAGFIFGDIMNSFLPCLSKDR